MPHTHPTSTLRAGATSVSPVWLAILMVAAIAAIAAAAPQAPAANPAPAVKPAQGVAAPGLDAILRELSTWDSGLESAAVWKLRDYVYGRKDDAAGRAECEAKLLAFLKTPATPAAKLTASRYLRVIAGDTAIPSLQALLGDDRSFDYALFVLQKLPGAAADKALVQALGAATAPASKTSLVAALGERRSLSAVPALVPLLKNPALAGAAAISLGAIGGADANQALAAALPGASGDLKPTIAAAMMRCAEQALSAKNAAGALKLYEAVFADAALPPPVHRAAALGRISAAGPGAPALLLEFLGGPDARLQQAAVMKIKDVFPPDAIGQVCAALPRLPEATRVQVLAALSGYPKERVLPAVLDAAKSDSPAVRLAAMKALEAVGDESALAFLLDTAAKTRGTEQAAARSAIGLLKGRTVDERLLAMLAKAPSDEVQGELLLAVADRRIYVAKPAVAAALTAPSVKVRTQALRSLRLIGTPSDIPAVLDLMVKTDDDTERAEAETTVGSLSQKIVNSQNRSTFVRTRLATEADPAARVRLIGVLPRIADSSALPVIRRALADENPDVYDAAVRALTAWPTAAARDDVFRLARDSRNETHRLLAIRALVQAITVDKFRAPDEAVSDLRTAAGFAWRPEEQKLVLGALVQFPCRDALDLANGFLREPTVKEEAQAAIDEITKKMK